MTCYSIHPRSKNWWVEKKGMNIIESHFCIRDTYLIIFYKTTYSYVWFDDEIPWSIRPMILMIGSGQNCERLKKVEFRYIICLRTITLFHEYFAWSENERFKNDFSHVSMTKNELLIHSRLLSWVIFQLCQVIDQIRFVCRSSVKFFNHEDIISDPWNIIEILSKRLWSWRVRSWFLQNLFAEKVL